MEPWSSVAVACGFAVVWLFMRPDGAFCAYMAEFWIGGALLDTCVRYSIYYDLDPVRLRKRWFWKTTEVAWPDITHVELSGIWADKVRIHYRLDPENSSIVVARPNDLGKFVEAVRKFAPQASVKV
jgi:hypothetical protein